MRGMEVLQDEMSVFFTAPCDIRVLILYLFLCTASLHFFCVLLTHILLTYHSPLY
jgi:hypothetical protein